MRLCDYFAIEACEFQVSESLTVSLFVLWSLYQLELVPAMASSSQDTGIKDCDNVLFENIEILVTAMTPLLSNPNWNVVSNVLQAVRQVNASQEAIATTLALFCKLLHSAQDTDSTKSNTAPNTPTATNTSLNTNPATTNTVINNNNDNPNNPSNSSNQHQMLFRSFIQQLEAAGLVQRAHLYQAFDPEDRTQFLDRSVNHINERKRQRTRMWFTQTRYNLYCEQSEGYAKVITLLFSVIEATTQPNSQQVIDELVILIGQFSLDTNRVIEIVLSAASEVVGELISRSCDLPFDHRLPPTFAAILDQFPKHHVYSVVGAMFHVFFPLRQISKHDSKEDTEFRTSSNSNASKPMTGSMFVSPEFARFGVKHSKSLPQSPITSVPQQPQKVGHVLPSSAKPYPKLTAPANSSALGMNADPSNASPIPAQEALTDHAVPPSATVAAKSPSRYENEWVQKLLANNFPPAKPGPAYFKFDHDDPAMERRAFNSFLGLVVVLLREGYFAISDIWHHVHPQKNEQLFAACEKFETELAELSTYVCSSTSQPPKHIADDPTKVPLKNSNNGEHDLWQQYKFISQGPFSGASHQRFELINMLISMCRWRDAKAAILHLCVGDEHVDIAAEPNITKTLAAIVDVLISPALRSSQGSPHTENKAITNAIEKLGGSTNGYVALIRSVDELLCEDPDSPGAEVRDMLKILGPYARGSVRLLFSLCHLLKRRKEATAFEIMRDVVLPASSLVQSNSALSEAIWDVLKEWPHHKRWCTYGHVQNEVFGSCSIYQLYAKRASYEMRYILKRLTSETRARHMTTVAKLTHGQALPAFSAALDRIQGYPADLVTITPIVEACKKCTDLSLDILMFLATDRMADSRRSRLKKDGINVAQWYATLSLFLGISLRKLPLLFTHVEGVTNFLCKKLAVEPEPLLITALSDIIKCVADVDVDVNLTSKQIKACGGGTVLQELVNGSLGRLQPDPNMIGCSFDPRLEREKNHAINGLQRALSKSGVHTDLAVSIAQLTRSAIFDDDLKAMPLKLCANVIDKARASLMQLSQFLRLVPKGVTRAKETQKALWRPLKSLGLANLLTEMNTPISSAVILMSPTLDFLTTAVQSGLPETTPERSDTDGSKMQSTEEPSTSRSPNSKPDKTEPTISAEDKGASTSAEMASHRIKPLKSVASFDEVVSDRTKGVLSPALVHAFWTLKLGDIAVPVDLYEEERNRMLSIKSIWENELEQYRRHTSGELDRARRCETEYSLIQDFTTDLEEEKAAMMKRHDAVLEKLRKIRDDLHRPSSSGTELERQHSARLFLQECVIPRCRISVPDALFCSRFIILMFQMDIPVVSFSHFFENFLLLIPTLLRSCSENEALGVTGLINELLSMLEKWRSNKTNFELEMGSLKYTGLQYVDKNGEGVQFKHERLCEWLFDIHQRLTAGMCEVVSSKEYLYSRNSLSVLVGVSEFFPKVTEHAKRIDNAVGELVNSDMEDLRLTANGVLARLRAGGSMRIPEHIFRLKPQSSHAAGSNNTPSSGPTATQSGNKAISKLKSGGESAATRKTSSQVASVKEAPSSRKQDVKSDKMVTDPETVNKTKVDLKAKDNANGNGQREGEGSKGNDDAHTNVPEKTDPLPISGKRKSPEKDKQSSGNDGKGDEPSTELAERASKRARANTINAKDEPRECRPGSHRDNGTEECGEGASHRKPPVSPDEHGRRTPKDEPQKAAQSEVRQATAGRKVAGDKAAEPRHGSTERRSPGARASPGGKSPKTRPSSRTSPSNTRSPAARGGEQKSPRVTEVGNERGQRDRVDRGTKRAYSEVRDDGARREGERGSNGRDGGNEGGNSADGGTGTRGMRSHGNSGNLPGGDGGGGPLNKRRRDGGSRSNYGEGRRPGRGNYDGRYGGTTGSPRGIRNNGSGNGGASALNFDSVLSAGRGPGMGRSASGRGEDNKRRGDEDKFGWVLRKRENALYREGVLDGRATSSYGMAPHGGAPVGPMTPSLQPHRSPSMMGSRESPGRMPSGSSGMSRPSPNVDGRENERDRDRDRDRELDREQFGGRRDHRESREGLDRGRERDHDHGRDRDHGRGRDRDRDRDRDRMDSRRRMPPVRRRRGNGGNGGGGDDGR